MHQIRKYLIFFLISLSSASAIAQVDHWESVITPGSEFNFLVPTSELPTNWVSLNFNDEQWNTGGSSIGYGDDDDVTVVSNIASVFMRKTFTIIDISTIEELLFHMDYDDGLSLIHI